MKETIEITESGDIGLHYMPWREGDPEYYFKGLCEYAKAKGVKPIDLTDEEREQFRTN
ncbi:hypothetical protein [Granulicatella seriolae]|uniref:Uncharacterized protein n=1 Tax=Granulicatella seriolae TaxID=2967226 RepID=A0ABT1WQU6_9LACT|nr:hypothetical protein [Granulicatella seriolae]